MKRLKVWINRRFVGIDDAKISAFDRGFLYGDGIFETMRSYAGKVFRLDEHLDRLFASLKIVRIKLPYKKRYLERIIYKSLAINDLKSAYIRLTITRGEGRFGINYRDKFTPNLVMVAKEFGDYPGWMYKKGISAAVVSLRQNEYSPTTKIKSLNFLNYILARLEAKAKGFDEAILTNTKGAVAEGATSNIFLIKNRRLATPSLKSGIVPGVTRAVIIGIAKSLRLDLKEGQVSYKELLNSDEVFLTNSLAEVLPVIRIDSKMIGDGQPGDITKLLHVSYQKEVIRYSLQ